MDILLPFVLFAVGVVALVWGGDAFVDGASTIAAATGIPKFVIGATVVSIGTTMPELTVSLMATAGGSIDMAVGNAVGSVSANTGLIMGLSLLLLPGALREKTFASKGGLMALSAAVLGFFLRDNQLGRGESLVMLVLFLTFIAMNLLPGRSGSKDGEREEKKEVRWPVVVARFLLGLGGILIGAQLLVNNGTTLARLMGASEAFIGLTLVAVGTSLPELITTITAIRRKESALSVGNILGANIIDMTLILACCSFASPGGVLTVAQRTWQIDVPVCLGLMAIAIIPTLMTKRFARWQGLLLIVFYIGYVVSMLGT